MDRPMDDKSLTLAMSSFSNPQSDLNPYPHGLKKWNMLGLPISIFANLPKILSLRLTRNKKKR